MADIDQSTRADLAKLEDHIGHISTWPTWMRELAAKPWLRTSDRLTLVVNLIGNVTPPMVVARHAAPRLSDKNACDDVATLLKRIRDGHYCLNGAALQYWDLAQKQIVPLCFSKVRETVCWDPAILIYYFPHFHSPISYLGKVSALG